MISDIIFVIRVVLCTRVARGISKSPPREPCVCNRTNLNMATVVDVFLPVLSTSVQLHEAQKTLQFPLLFVYITSAVSR